MNPPEITLYGIPSCDSVKKARSWLSAAHAAHVFHDFKKQGVPADRLDAWIQALGWQKLLNRQGTTWRRLDAAAQAAVQDVASAKALMLAQPSVIKRPVVEWGRAPAAPVTAGFDPQTFTSALPAAPARGQPLD